MMRTVDYLDTARVALAEAHAAFDRAAAPDLAERTAELESDAKARRELVEHGPSDGSVS
jgi:hypothetical protein